MGSYGGWMNFYVWDGVSESIFSQGFGADHSDQKRFNACIPVTKGNLIYDPSTDWPPQVMKARFYKNRDYSNR